MPKPLNPSPRKSSSRTSPDRRQRVRSAEIGVSVLRALAEIGGTASLTSISERLDESPAKVHRYLASMVEADFVFQEAQSGRYVLGPAAIAVGIAALHQSNPLAYAVAELKVLAGKHGLAAFVSVFGNRGPVVMWCEQPRSPVVLTIKAGSVLPVLWSATGRAFGVFLPSDQMEALIQRELREATPERQRMLHDRKAVRAMFAEVRGQGCALVRDAYLPGVAAIAAPVFDASTRAVAVITVLGVAGTFELDPSGHVAVLVKQAASHISRRLGSPAEESRQWFPGIS